MRFRLSHRMMIIMWHDDENPMHVYLNVHGMLEQLRQKAETEKTRGPRVRNE